MIGVAIKEARELKGITQKDLGKESLLSEKTISAIETGRRGITQENLKILCKELDDPRLYFEAASEICGDVFAINWLDGEAADLHRASVREKVIEELDEAIKAIYLTKTYKQPAACGGDDIKAIETSIKETIDVFDASAIYITVMCREFGLNIKDMFRLHKEKLIFKRFLRGEKR